MPHPDIPAPARCTTTCAGASPSSPSTSRVTSHCDVTLPITSWAPLGSTGGADRSSNRTVWPSLQRRAARTWPTWPPPPVMAQICAVWRRRG
eukprot:425290-Prymnesium_polylepis.1